MTAVRLNPTGSATGTRLKLRLGDDLNGSVCREAARILAKLIERIHVPAMGAGSVSIAADISERDFDRLCVWGAALEDFEDEAPEPDSDREEDLAV